MARGSTANVIPASAAFCLPGLGQLMQGRVLAAIFYFLLSAILWGVLGYVGVLGHLAACLDAALWRGGISTSL